MFIVPSSRITLVSIQNHIVHDFALSPHIDRESFVYRFHRSRQLRILLIRLGKHNASDDIHFSRSNLVVPSHGLTLRIANECNDHTHNHPFLYTLLNVARGPHIVLPDFFS